MTEHSSHPGPDRAEASEREERPLGLISEEEIRALLSPLGEAPTIEDEPVLIVGDRLGEREAIAASLREAGTPVVLVRNAFVAADMLRSGSFRALVAALEALPADLETFLARIRPSAPSLLLCLIRNQDETPPEVDGAVLARPLSPQRIERLTRLLAAGSGAGEAPRQTEVRPPARDPGSLPPSPRDTVAPGRDLAPPSSASRGPDPLAAVKAALEARLAGEDTSAGLARWAAAEPSIRGAVDLREDLGATRFRVTGEKPEDRRQMVLLLLQVLEERRHDPTRSASLGSFSFLPGRTGEGDALALFHEDPEEGRAFLDRLSPLLPLLESLERGQPSPGAARARFVALLESRMRAAERTGSRLGILLLRGGKEDDPREVTEGLRSLLRGGDWVETVDDTAYVILDQPSQEVFMALGRRLRGLPSVERLQVAALGWAPEEGGATALVERAEHILRTGGGEEGLPGLTRR